MVLSFLETESWCDSNNRTEPVNPVKNPDPLTISDIFEVMTSADPQNHPSYVARTTMVGTMSTDLAEKYRVFNEASEKARKAFAAMSAESARWHSRKICGIKIRVSEREEHAETEVRLKSAYDELFFEFKFAELVFREQLESEFPALATKGRIVVQGDQIGWNTFPHVCMFELRAVA